jgi:hypothetical protein
MNVSEAFSLFLKARRIVVIISIVAGAGSYKYGPTVWQTAEAKMGAKPGVKAVASTAAKAPVLQTGVATNADGLKLSNCDLGAVSLTNHYETCVSLGKGKECLLTPLLIDSHNVQITVTLESRNAQGKIHDLSITQIVAKTGEPFEVAVGDVSFSLTPNVMSLTPE